MPNQFGGNEDQFLLGASTECTPGSGLVACAVAVPRPGSRSHRATKKSCSLQGLYSGTPDRH